MSDDQKPREWTIFREKNYDMGPGVHSGVLEGPLTSTVNVIELAAYEALLEELKIQDQANDILTRERDELNARLAALSGAK